MTGAQHDHVPPATPTAWQALTAQEKYQAVKHALHAEHMSYGEAALALGASRVAIAGVVERSKRNPLGPIVSSIRPTTGGKKAAWKPKPKRAGFHKFVPLAGAPNGVSGPFTQPVDPAPIAPDEIWLPLPGSKPVVIAEHTIGCRWPCGQDRPFIYCNAPIKFGSPYCSAHAAIAFRALPPRKELA